MPGNHLNIPETLPENIFRAYDIRGLADTELNDNVVYAIGLAIGSTALEQDQQRIVVAADGVPQLAQNKRDAGRRSNRQWL